MPKKGGFLQMLLNLVYLFCCSKTFNVTLTKSFRAWVCFNSNGGIKLFKTRTHLNHKSRNETPLFQSDKTHKDEPQQTRSYAVVIYPTRKPIYNRPCHVFEPKR